MWIPSFVASLHYLALGVGFWSVVERGRALRAFAASKDSAADAKRIFFYDSFWGVAALLWVGTGLLRAFAGLEKGSAYYLANSLFWTKLSLFVLLLILELIPMITFIRWRIAERKGVSFPVSEEKLKRLKRINTLEIFLVILIVFVAGLMARGIGL